jgi:hypothetical protein
MAAIYQDPPRTYLQTRSYPQSLRVETYIREDLPGASDRINAVLDRLTRLTTEKGTIDSVTVTKWTTTMPARLSSESLAESQRTVHKTVAEFREWAARQGCSLTPAFDWRGDDEAETKDKNERLRVPIISLAVYETGAADNDTEDGDERDESEDDDDLLVVFPYTDRDGEVQTIEDGLVALEES